MTYTHTATDAFSARIPGAGLVTAPTPFMTARNALAQIGAAISRVNTALMNGSTGMARVRRVEALQARSDAELRAMGVKREDIVHHVFRDFY